jgi:hypothetical protein
MPLGLGHLTSLEILSLFVVGSETSLGILSRLFVGWFKKKRLMSSGGLSELKELSNLGGSLLLGGWDMEKMTWWNVKLQI